VNCSDIKESSVEELIPSVIILVVRYWGYRRREEQLREVLAAGGGSSSAGWLEDRDHLEGSTHQQDQEATGGLALTDARPHCKGRSDCASEEPTAHALEYR
jgi:hypothetical protein